eukprot:1415273-Amphidinium_carterae.1
MEDRCEDHSRELDIHKTVWVCLRACVIEFTYHCYRNAQSNTTFQELAKLRRLAACIEVVQ